MNTLDAKNILISLQELFILSFGKKDLRHLGMKLTPIRLNKDWQYKTSMDFRLPESHLRITFTLTPRRMKFTDSKLLDFPYYNIVTHLFYSIDSETDIRQMVSSHDVLEWGHVTKIIYSLRENIGSILEYEHSENNLFYEVFIYKSISSVLDNFKKQMKKQSV